MGQVEAIILQTSTHHTPALLLQKKFVQPSVLSEGTPPPSTIHSCLAPSGPWFTAGLGPAASRPGSCHELLSQLQCWAPASLDQARPLLLSGPQPCLLGVPLETLLGARWLPASVLLPLLAFPGQRPVTTFPLAPVLGEVQTLGVDPKKLLEHSPLVPIHDVLRQGEDILALTEMGPGQVSSGGPVLGIPAHSCLPCLPPHSCSS